MELELLFNAIIFNRVNMKRCKRAFLGKYNISIFRINIFMPDLGGKKRLISSPKMQRASIMAAH